MRERVNWGESFLAKPSPWKGWIIACEASKFFPSIRNAMLRRSLFYAIELEWVLIQNVVLLFDLHSSVFNPKISPANKKSRFSASSRHFSEFWSIAGARHCGHEQGAIYSFIPFSDHRPILTSIFFRLGDLRVQKYLQIVRGSEVQQFADNAEWKFDSDVSNFIHTFHSQIFFF